MPGEYATGSFASLFLTRLLMGAAEGPFLPVAQSLVAVESTAARRGSFVAPLVLVMIATALSWRWAFFLAGIPGLIMALCAVVGTLLALFLRGIPSRPRNCPSPTSSGASSPSVRPMCPPRSRARTTWRCRRRVGRPSCRFRSMTGTRSGQQSGGCRSAVAGCGGASVARNRAWDETLALAERHNAAVWVAPMSARNSFPENHRLFAGFLPADRSGIVKALTGNDLVLVLGAPAFTYHVEGDGPHVPRGAQLLQLTDDAAVAAWCPMGTSIVTDLKLGVAQLLALTTAAANSSTPLRTAPTIAARPPQRPAEVLDGRYLMQQIAAVRPAHSILVEEAPSSRAEPHDYLPIIERDSFHTCASGGLGHGLPAAIGVALAQPQRKVIALLGDGPAMYAIQGLQEFGQHFGIASLPCVQLGGLDFCARASAQGVRALRVERAADLDPALQQVFGAGVPMLLEVCISSLTGAPPRRGAHCSRAAATTPGTPPPPANRCPSRWRRTAGRSRS